MYVFLVLYALFLTVLFLFIDEQTTGREEKEREN